MKTELLRTDITTLPAGAIVNAANNSLMGGGGVDGAIHRKGGPAILEECRRIVEKQGGCPTGEAVYTSGGNMPAQYVIHTVGPIWHGGQHGEPELLKNCYLNSLLLAESLGVKTIAFPNISTGVYGYPKDQAAAVAVETVRNFQASTLEKAIFVCFDEENFHIYQSLIP
ncbi:MAG: O-acetyl-ADP-ribose deacetylase [Saprospiraceae bacterium]